MKKLFLLATAALMMAACSDLTTEEVESNNSTRANTVSVDLVKNYYTFDCPLFGPTCLYYDKSWSTCFNGEWSSSDYPEDTVWRLSNGMCEYYSASANTIYASFSATHTHPAKTFCVSDMHSEYEELNCSDMGRQCPDLQAAIASILEFTSNNNCTGGHEFISGGLAGVGNEEDLIISCWNENDSFFFNVSDLPHTHGQTPEPSAHGGQGGTMN